MNVRQATRLTGIAALAPALFGGLALAAEPTRTSAEVAEAMQRLRVDEAATPIRQNPRWRQPRKILLLAFGSSGWNERLDDLRAAASGPNVVAASSHAQAVTEAADADVIVGFNPDICDQRILGAAKELRWVQSLNAGVDLCMRAPAIRAPNLLVTNMRGVDSPVIAEHAIAMMLALAHGLDVFAVDTAQEVWSRDHAATVPLQMMTGKTLLVSGLGSIGTEIAQRAHGLGMKVIATRQGDGPSHPFVETIAQPDQLLTLARRADVVISAVPLTKETTGLYDAKFFAAMKPPPSS